MGYVRNLTNQEFDTLVHQIISIFGGVRPYADRSKLYNCYSRKNPNTLVHEMLYNFGFRGKVALKVLYYDENDRERFHGFLKFIERRHSVHFSSVEKGCYLNGSKRLPAAQIYIPRNTPSFPMMSNSTVYLVVRKDIASSFDIFVVALAHEFSHLALFCVKKELWQDEIAVDIAVMVLGYLRFVNSASITGSSGGNVLQSGYLTKEQSIRCQGIVYQHIGNLPDEKTNKYRKSYGLVGVIKNLIRDLFE